MTKRKKKERFECRVSNGSVDKIREIAIALGYKYGQGAALGELIDAIASAQRSTTDTHHIFLIKKLDKD